MRKVLLLIAVAFTLACLMPAPAAQAEMLTGQGRGMHRIGLGFNYWKTIDTIGMDVDSDGFSYIASYQYAPVWYLKIGTNLELFTSLAGSENVVLAPELFVTAGGLFYGGVGIGSYYHSGDGFSDPFYMFRAGLDIPVLPRLFLDLNINYRFNDWKTLQWSEIDTETLRLGAAVRFVL